MQNSFVEYYKGLYKGRRVTFQNSLETCIIRANFPLGAKELSVSVFQYLVLSCFNDIDTLTVEEIQSQTNISIKELSRTLSSLTSQKTRLLIEETNEKYSINKDFSHQLFRIKVTMGQTRTIEETITTNSRVYQDRKHILEALIVRIMKEKRRITHDELVGIVFERSLFGIKNSDVKERIETLIDREYIERGENGVYVYVA